MRFGRNRAIWSCVLCGGSGSTEAHRALKGRRCYRRHPDNPNSCILSQAPPDLAQKRHFVNRYPSREAKKWWKAAILPVAIRFRHHPWQVNLQVELAGSHESDTQKNGGCRPATAVLTGWLFESRNGAFRGAGRAPDDPISAFYASSRRPPEQREIQVQGAVNLVVVPVSHGEVKVRLCEAVLLVRP